MKLTTRQSEFFAAASAPYAYDGARAHAHAAEAARLGWNRASQRIVRAAQERVALEPINPGR
jgi:hypothetical protein